jgi:hypothetical protein
MKKAVLLLSLLFWTSSFAGEPKAIRLLTIGNSFSANGTHYFSVPAKSGERTLIHQPLVIGGALLQVNVDKAKAVGKARAK